MIGLEVHDHKLAVLFKEAVHHALQQNGIVRVERGKVPHGPEQREAVLALYLFAFPDACSKVAPQEPDDRAHIDGVRLLVRQLALCAHRFDLRAHALLVWLAEKVEILHHKMQRRAAFGAGERRLSCKEFWFTEIAQPWRQRRIFRDLLINRASLELRGSQLGGKGRLFCIGVAV